MINFKLGKIHLQGGIKEMLSFTFDKEKNHLFAYDGKAEIGYISFSQAKDVWIIEEVYLDAEYNIKIFILQIIDKFVYIARENKKKIIALDSLAKSVFSKNTKYIDVIS